MNTKQQLQAALEECDSNQAKARKILSNLVGTIAPEESIVTNFFYLFGGSELQSRIIDAVRQPCRENVLYAMEAIAQPATDLEKLEQLAKMEI